MRKKISGFNTDYRLITGYIIAFLLLLISYLLTLYSNKELIKQTQLVSHTHKAISDLENLLSAVKDGETGLRGFLNSKDSIFLEPFFKSISTTEAMFKTVEIEATDQRQKEKLKLLHGLISRKYENIELSITHFLAHNFTIDQVLLESSYSGRAVMDSIRLTILDMQHYENNLLGTRSKKVDSRYIALNTIVITSLVLAFIFAAFGVVTFVKENKARKQADQKVSTYQEVLKQRIAELDLANKEIMEAKREEKFASTGRIARIIAHEVRNPLTNIDLAVSQIKEEVGKENEEVDFLFDMVTRNSSRINQLITELLNATRVTDLTFKTISITDILEASLTAAKDRIELNKIQVKEDYSASTAKVSVDEEKIKIAFLNIILNAIEAMKDREDAVLTICTRLQDTKCIIEISDNGVGMDKIALVKLFEAYYTTKPKGNGLGLTNTQNIIMNHKGTLDVESEAGVGTKFIIRLNTIT